MTLSLVCVLALIVGDDPKPAKPAAAKPVPVTIRIQVPAATPADAKVYLAGNLPSVGAWNPKGVALEPLKDGRFATTILVPRGETFEYKFTLGDWGRVEIDVPGKIRDNRVLVVKADEQQIEVEHQVIAWAVPKVRKSTVTGTVKSHLRFASKILSNSRTILVWLPPGYEAEPAKRYPVAYFQDGQNIFDDATSANGEWHADETADRLIRERKLPPMILVAIANTSDRMNEYTPVKDVRLKLGGKGARYARFVAEELKPFIDTTYRTRPGRETTAVIGSSLGGLIAMEMTLNHPEVFGLCGAISPSGWWANKQLLADVKSHADAAKLGRFWIDMGTREGARKPDAVSPAVDRVKMLADALKADGLTQERDYHLEIIEGGEHNETAWAARLDQVLLYLFQGVAK